MRLQRADKEDLRSILELQYLAYRSEAELLGNFDIPPLKQTIEDVQREFQNGIVLKAVTADDTITGSVRGYAENGTLFVGKLIVHPDFQKRGIGTQLLQEIENVCPQPRYELFTSDKSSRNMRLYERLGYVPFASKQVTPVLTFIYLEKHAENVQ